MLRYTRYRLRFLNLDEVCNSLPPLLPSLHFHPLLLFEDFSLCPSMLDYLPHRHICPSSLHRSLSLFLFLSLITYNRTIQTAFFQVLSLHFSRAFCGILRTSSFNLLSFFGVDSRLIFTDCSYISNRISLTELTKATERNLR